MRLGAKIRNGAKWMVAGTVGNRVLEFGFGIILARLLVPADFGVILTLQLFTGFVGALTSGGMAQSLIRAKNIDNSDFSAVFTVQLCLGIATYLAFFFAAPYFGEFYGEPYYADLLRVSALIFLMRPFALSRSAWLTREMLFKRATQVAVITALASGVFGSAMAFAGMGVWSLVLSGLAAGLVRNIVLARLTPVELFLSFDRKVIRRHAGFGVKITVLEFIGDLKKRALVFFLGKMAGPAFLGLFNKGQSLALLPAHILIPPIGRTVFRALSKIQDDLDQTKYLFYKVISVLGLFVFPALTYLWWVAEPFILFVYGEKWMEAAAPMQIMVLSGYFLALEIPCAVLLTAQAQLRQQIIFQIVTLVVISLTCVLTLHWDLGLTGVAWGMVGAQLFSTIYSQIMAHNVLPSGLSQLFVALRPGLLLNVLLFATLAGVDHLLGATGGVHPLLYLAVMGVVGGGLYALLFLFLPLAALKPEADYWKGLLRGQWQQRFGRA